MKTIKLITLLGLLSFAGQSYAMPIMCGASIANNVSSTSGCELGSTNNDFLNPLQVNIDQMFGYDDWEFGQKGFDSDMDIDLGLSLAGNTISGTWAIDDIWSSYENVMLVIKGGGGNNTVSTYVGYLVDFGSITGDYFTPFANGNNGNPKDISHMSIYVRETAAAVSEPASLALIGLGIVLVGFARRRA